MSRTPWLPFLMLALWAALVVAFQAAWLHRWLPLGGAGTWFFPDWNLILLVALLVRIPVRFAGRVTLVLALVRMAYSDDAPVTILAAYAWVAFGVQALRSGVDVSGALPRMLIAFLAAIGVAVWGQLVQYVRHPLLQEGFPASLWWELGRRALPGALVTGWMVGLFGPGFARLPGLSSLYQRSRF